LYQRPFYPSAKQFRKVPFRSFPARSANILTLTTGKKALENLLFIDLSAKDNPVTPIGQTDIYNADIETIYNFAL
jgi:hypothetical protein